MANKKIRFTALDFVLILILLFLATYFFIRSSGIALIKGVNYRTDAIITVKVDNIPKDNFNYFIAGERIYRSEDGKRKEIGIISDIRSCPAVKLVEDKHGFVYTVDFDAVDILLDIAVDSVFDRNSFYSVDGTYYMPSLDFVADNGRIKFDCEVVSVKNKG